MTFRARCGTGHGLDAAPYNETAPNLPDVTFIQGALTPSLPQRGRVSPTRATGEGERDGTAMWE